MFYTITGHSKYLFREYSIINVKVFDIDENGIRVVTNSGIVG